ncbi:hypothetical protein D3C75_885950 [compost metagenome]
MDEAALAENQTATRLSTSELESLSICPLSESRARLLVANPPKNSSSMMVKVMIRAHAKPFLLPLASK